MPIKHRGRGVARIALGRCGSVVRMPGDRPASPKRDAGYGLVLLASNRHTFCSSSADFSSFGFMRMEGPAIVTMYCAEIQLKRADIVVTPS